MPYTPTPLVNFQYEPEKSDVRRLLDTQAKIKKEKQADQSFEMEMKQAQQAYDMGVLKIKEAQMKTDELLKAKSLDDESGKIFQSIRASGGSEADALRAVKAYRTQNGGWKQMQIDQEAEQESLTKALSMAKISPALADRAASMINSNLDPNATQMTGAQLYELQNRKEPIKINEQGDFMIFTFDPATGQYTPKIQRFQSKEQAEEAAQEQKNKQRGFDLEQARVNAQYAGYATQLKAEGIRAQVDREQMASAERIAQIGMEKAIGVQELKGVQDIEKIKTKGDVQMVVQGEKIKSLEKLAGLSDKRKEAGQKIVQKHNEVVEKIAQATLELNQLKEKNDVRDRDRVYELNKKVKEFGMDMDKLEYELEKYKAEDTKTYRKQKLEVDKENQKIARERIQATLSKYSGSTPASAEGKAIQKQAEKASADLSDALEFAAKVQEARGSELAQLLRAKGMVPAQDVETNRQRALDYVETVRARTLRAYDSLEKYNPGLARELRYIHNSSASNPNTATPTSDLYNAPWMK